MLEMYPLQNPCNNVFWFYRRDLEQAREVESLKLEGDIGGGLILQREIYVPNDNPKIFCIDSSIEARKVGAGSGGFSRLDLISLYCTKKEPESVLNTFVFFG